MKLGLGAIHEVTEEKLKFAKQFGVDHIVVHTPDLSGDGYWEFMDLLRLRTLVESAGLKLAAIENIPRSYYDKVRLGLPGRDEQIENWCKTLRNMGKAGIPILGYDFHLVGVWRTEKSPRGRGGAYISSFDYERVKDAPLPAKDSYGYDLVAGAPLALAGEMTEEEMWDNYTYFLKAVIPVAEEAGVKMGLHPDDPPVPILGGTVRIFRSIDALKRLIDIVPSDYNGLEFCQGTVAEMGADVIEAIRYFGSRKKIFYVHFRNIKGTVPKFDEVFIDEGDMDMFKAMRAYKEVGYDGVMIPDHTPGVVDDTGWGHRGRAFALGYMKALVQAVNSLP
jgi:mannonate dehydratase